MTPRPTTTLRERSYSTVSGPLGVASPAAASVTVRRIVRRAASDGFDASVEDGQVDSTVGSLRLAVHSFAMFGWVLAIGLAAMAVLPIVAGYRPVVVTSGSMSPSVDRGDIVVTSQLSTKDVVVGSVVDHDIDGRRRIHRVVEVTDDGYRTKGDSNPSIDSGVVARDQIRGVGVLVVPLIGLPSVWLTDGQWLPLGLVVVLLVGTARFARPRWVLGTRPLRRRRIGVDS